MMLSRLPVFIVCLYSVFALAHGNESSGEAKQPNSKPPYTLTPVIQQALSDPALQGYEMLAVRLDIVPGGVDPAPHRHDADTFVYVLQGDVETELEGRKSTYSAGSMFHEPRNALHSLLRNVSATKPASVLAVFVIKNGREFYVPAVK